MLHYVRGFKVCETKSIWFFSCGYFIRVLIFQLWIFYPSFVAKSDCDGNEPAHVSQPPTLQPTYTAKHFSRAMQAQPFTDKLIRNICRSHWRLFCIFVTHLCVYLCALRRYISVYLLLISSDSRKLARSIKTELMKQNLFPCLKKHWVLN